MTLTTGLRDPPRYEVCSGYPHDEDDGDPMRYRSNCMSMRRVSVESWYSDLPEEMAERMMQRIRSGGDEESPPLLHGSRSAGRLGSAETASTASPRPRPPSPQV